MDTHQGKVARFNPNRAAALGEGIDILRIFLPSVRPIRNIGANKIYGWVVVHVVSSFIFPCLVTREQDKQEALVSQIDNHRVAPATRSVGIAHSGENPVIEADAEFIDDRAGFDNPIHRNVQRQAVFEKPRPGIAATQQ